MSVQDKEFEMRVDRLRALLKEASKALNEENPNRMELLKFLNRIPVYIQPIEKSRPAKKVTADDDPLKFFETASPVLMDAEEIAADLNTRLTFMDNEMLRQSTSKQKEYYAPPPRHMEIKIPTFNGEYSKYPEFISSFRVATEHPNATKAQKFLVLKSHLGPKPALLLTGLDPSDQSFDKALAALEETYNVRTRIIDDLQEQFVKLAAATDDAQSLKHTYMTSEALLRAMEYHGVKVDENDMLRKVLLRKYPQRIRDSISPMEKLTLKIMRERMNLIVQNKEDVESIVGSVELGPTADATTAKDGIIQQASESIVFASKVQQTTDNSQSKNITPTPRPAAAGVKICIFCTDDHYSSKCTKYETSTKRRDALPPGTCFICFKAGHHSRVCRSRSLCYFCRKNTHNSAMCPDKFGKFEQNKVSPNKEASKPAAPNAETEQTNKKPSEVDKRNVNLALNEKGTHLTARATIRNPVTGTKMSTRVFLDCGSDSTYILNDHARNLELKTIDRKELSVTVFLREIAETVSADAVHLELLSDENASFRLHVLADTVAKLPFINTYDVNEFRVDYPQFANRKFADTANLEQVGLMLGNDYLWHLISTETKIQVTNTLFLVNSVFGWLIVGRVPKSKFQVASSVVGVSVQESVSLLWSLDALGIREPNYTKEKEEELALEQFYNNICYDTDEKRYHVTWPWRSSPPDLPNNFALSKGRLLSLLKRYKNEQKYIKAVDDIFAQQIQSGIIEKVPNATPSNNTHYLPFHCVINENKSTPVRIVYDGSAKTKKSNNSINECLYKGINMLPDMISLLLRFRFEPIAITADIEKAFHQVTLQEHERDYLRFLWVERNTQEEDNCIIMTYRFRRVPFGIVSSPFILAAVITFLLRQKANKYTDQILQNLYVDNLITAVSDVKTACELFQSTVETFNYVSMNIRNWSSNNEEFIGKIPKKYIDMQNKVSILGLQWHRLNDAFTITVPVAPFAKSENTMRQVLKQSAKVYDPLGWMSPVTVRAKIMLQKMHENRYKWDQKLDNDEIDTWRALYLDLQELKNIVIPRYFQTFRSKNPRFQLHCFADASKYAYAAAVYLRIQQNDTTRVELLFAKARVAPINKEDKLTIPRLELMGALIGSRLIRTTRQSLKIQEDKPAILWLDSKCALSWIETTNELPTFVRNRVQEIKTVENLEFRHVPGVQNIADLPSRTCSTAELKENGTWWNGPKWLSENESNWPLQKVAEDTGNDEGKTEKLVEKTAMPVATKTSYRPFHIKIEKFNSYVKLIRVTAYAVRFVRLIAKRRNIFPSNQDTTFGHARNLWIKAAQTNAYHDVLENLKQSRIKPMSIVKKLRLFKDSKEILRCAGRFQNAPIDEDAKYPILLPKPINDQFTFLLVLHYHSMLKHAGTNATLLKIRGQFWFPKGKQQTYHVITKCRPCAREIAKPYRQPTESDLPKCRFDMQESPFTYIGLDMCGPFTVLKQNNYILITTCLVTRGVSLEVVDCLETAQIHAALRRIFARRNTPKFYLSDNMRQFVLIKQHILCSAVDTIVWKFIPEYTPWEGGAYERLIKLFKASLYRSIRENPFCGPTQFRTIVAEIEAAINDRPLTAVDAEIGIKPLTPNHFLRIQYSPTNFEAKAPVPATTAIQQLLTINKRVNEVLRQFWNIWTSLYLQYLRERPASMKFQNQTRKQQPQIGDVVIIRDELRKRSSWKLGVITGLLDSNDKKVRAAKLRTATGKTTVRPLRDLYYMELNEIQEIADPQINGNTTENRTESIEEEEPFSIDSIEVEEVDI